MALGASPPSKCSSGLHDRLKYLVRKAQLAIAAAQILDGVAIALGFARVDSSRAQTDRSPADGPGSWHGSVAPSGN